MGSGVKKPSKGEEPERQGCRRGIYAARSLLAGTIVKEDDVKVVRQVYHDYLGADEEEKVIGRKLKGSIEAGKPLKMEMIE